MRSVSFSFLFHHVSYILFANYYIEISIGNYVTELPIKLPKELPIALPVALPIELPIELHKELPIEYCWHW